jgi:hypothetical protein
MGDGAVGRRGENAVKQGERIAVAIADELEIDKQHYEHGLDFGCGWGRLSPVLAECCQHLWVVDIFDDWVQRAASLPNVTGVTLTGPQLPLDKQSVNLIADIMTFQSIASPQLKAQYASELLRVAVPGATFISLAKANDEWTRNSMIQQLKLPNSVRAVRRHIDEAGDEYYFLVGKLGGV